MQMYWQPAEGHCYMRTAIKMTLLDSLILITTALLKKCQIRRQYLVEQDWDESGC